MSAHPAPASDAGRCGPVGSAVQNPDQTTQQNAALVKETAAATTGFTEQARRLATEVGLLAGAACGFTQLLGVFITPGPPPGEAPGFKPQCLGPVLAFR